MNREYDLELDRVVAEINNAGAEMVLLHLPDGLKSKAGDIAERLKYDTAALVLIWAGSNFGACDLPVDADRIGVDMIIHFGHSAWMY
jgi:2-(3-amino-3-carboxypropyl)histidine synthase